MSINHVNISGNLTRDPEIRSTQSGMNILNFGMAVNDRRRNPQTGEYEDYANFVDCVLFGNRADFFSRHLHKGKKVYVEGKLRYSSWERDGQKRSKIEVVVDDIDLEFPPRQQGYQPQQYQQQGYQAQQYPPQQPQGYGQPAPQTYQQPQAYQQPQGYQQQPQGYGQPVSAPQAQQPANYTQPAQYAPQQAPQQQAAPPQQPAPQQTQMRMPAQPTATVPPVQDVYDEDIPF